MTGNSTVLGDHIIKYDDRHLKASIEAPWCKKITCGTNLPPKPRSPAAAHIIVTTIKDQILLKSKI